MSRDIRWSVKCPQCGARRGQTCVMYRNTSNAAKPTRIHRRRLELWEVTQRRRAALERWLS